MAEIEITHTRADGTLLDGSSKGDGVFDIVRLHGFRSFRSLGMLGIARSRDNEAPTWRINAAAEALRAAGHNVTVEINEDERRTFAEAEADREERAKSRAERLGDRADRAAASADARRAKADQISKRFEFGQPILVGHHSEGRARSDMKRIDNHMRKSFEERDRAAYWADRTRASENYEKHRKDPYRTLRRLERLRAELRQQERHHAEAVEKGWDSTDRYARRILDLTDEIAHWEQIVEEAKAEGVKVWGPDDFVAGDYVLYSRSWYEAVRVNPKTLSIAWNLRLAPKQVMTADDATDNGRTWTHAADYTNVRARCPGEAMRAFLADGMVPGTAEAHTASEAAPADVLRQAQAQVKKPKRRSDPKVPKRVKVDCRWNATEATLTWLDGRSQPHKGHAATTIAAPEGETFTESVWSSSLLSQVNELLAERGYIYRGRWTGSPGRGIVCAIDPAPAAEETGEAAQASDLQISRVNTAKNDVPNYTGGWVPTKVDLVKPTTTKGDAVTSTTTAKKPAKKTAKAEKAATTPKPATTQKSVQKTIPVDRIDRDPNQPREHFDQTKLQELADSIKALGLLQPVTVRYIPATRRYTLVMGERRWRAAQMAGLTEMTAVVLHGVPEGARETLAKAVAENVGRADMTPMEEAKGFKRLVDADYTIDEIAKMCGKSAAYVGWRIDLLRLCEPAQEALAKGHLPVGLSWYIASLNCDNQMRFLSKWTRGDFKNTRDAEAFAQAARSEEERQASQGSFFVLADETATDRPVSQSALPGALDLPEEERERITVDRQKLIGKVERLSTAGQILSELVAADPEELALLLAGAPGGVGAHRQRIEHLRDLTTKAIKNLRDAQALAAVRGNTALQINPQATTAE